MWSCSLGFQNGKSFPTGGFQDMKSDNGKTKRLITAKMYWMTPPIESGAEEFVELEKERIFYKIFRWIKRVILPTFSFQKMRRKSHARLSTNSNTNTHYVWIDQTKLWNAYASETTFVQTFNFERPRILIVFHTRRSPLAYTVYA